MKKIISTALVAFALVGSTASAFAHSGYQGPNEKSELAKQLEFFQQFADQN